MKFSAVLKSIVALIVWNMPAVQASIIIDTTDTIYVPTASPPSGFGINASVIVKQLPPEYIGGANSSFMDALATQFPGWTFNNGGSLNGTLKIKDYEAYTDPNGLGGGAIFDAVYEKAMTDPSLVNLHWIQMVTTNVPISTTAPSNYIDPYYAGYEYPQLPFYYSPISSEVDFLEDTHKDYSFATYNFYDAPFRPYPNPPTSFFMPPTGVSWRADLILASWDSVLTGGVGTVNLYDGVSWGFIIQRYPNSQINSFSGNMTSTQISTVPEPSSIVLAFSGLIVLSYYKFRAVK